MTASADLRRYAIDAPTLLHLAAEDAPLADDIRIVAPHSIRSDALTALLQRAQAGELTDADARRLHTRMTELPIRVLGDRVSRWTAYQLAREHGWTTLADAEYLAVAKLQADALVTVDAAMAALAEDVVTVAGVEVLLEEPGAALQRRADEGTGLPRRSGKGGLE
jgi:predicted nucleic acid-binding protein